MHVTCLEDNFMRPYIINKKTWLQRPYVSFANSILTAEELHNLDTSKPAQRATIDELRSSARLTEDEVLIDADAELYDPNLGEIRPLFKPALERVEELRIAVDALAERVVQLEAKAAE